MLASTATSKYSTPSAPWRIIELNVSKRDRGRKNYSGEGFQSETRLHLACADQFVVSELSQLSPQREVRIHQERLSTSLVEILERQSFAK